MTSNPRVNSVVKNLGLLYFLLLVFVFILFASIALIIPESAFLPRVVVSLVGSAIFFLITYFISFNTIYLQRVNQKVNTQFNKSSFSVIESTVDSMFTNTNIINTSNRCECFVSLLIATILGTTLFFLSTSHYLFYIVDNSGSMGICPNWTSEKGCPQPLLSPDKSTVKYVTKHLNKMFEADKSLGSIEVSKSSLPIFPFYKFTSDVKVGLIEIGGKTYLNGECSVNELAEPVLKNQKQLLEGLTKIKASDDGVTALIKSLRKADYSINLKTSNPLKYAASKNVILFTDSYEDNCGGKQIKFCEAASELPEGFDVKLNIYGISDTNTGKKFPCDKFKCGEKYSGQICHETPVDKIRQSSIPELGLVLSLSPTLTTTSYTSLVLSLICITLVIGMMLKYREELSNTYLKQVYSFIDSSNKKIEKVRDNTIEFLWKKEDIPRFILLIIPVIFMIILGIILLFR
jgi:hypothetical protein